MDARVANAIVIIAKAQERLERHRNGLQNSELTHPSNPNCAENIAVYQAMITDAERIIETGFRYLTKTWWFKQRVTG